MLKVLITGANGQLGCDLADVLSEGHQIYTFGRKEMDVTDGSQVLQTVHRVKPDAIIHTAAYTQVDQAEFNQDSAYLVNMDGTRNVTVAAQQAGAKLIYISTDYVFDGRSSIPYKEYDAANPQTVYGKSKLAGEEMVKALSDKYFIVRTSWLFGKHGQNFVKTMLRLSQQQKDLFVVSDQIGTPTFSRDLAVFLQKLIDTDKYGIYHVSNGGSCSWYEFAQAIFKNAGINPKVIPIETKNLGSSAPRPAYSVLDHMSIRLNGFQELRHWQEALTEFMRNDFLPKW